MAVITNDYTAAKTFPPIVQYQKYIFVIFGKHIPDILKAKTEAAAICRTYGIDMFPPIM